MTSTCHAAAKAGSLLGFFWRQFGDDFRNLSKRSLLNQEKICYRKASSIVFLRMRWVVFLRAVNVGSANRCQPALIAKELAKFGVVNIGAVGTFVVREDVSESVLRTAIAKKLPFKCEIMICPAKEIVDLAKENRVKGETSNDIDAHVTILARRPTKLPKLPFYAPSKDKWEIKISRVVETAALSLRRRVEHGHLYPNQIVEKLFGIPTTTRTWNTIEKVAKILTQDSKELKQNTTKKPQPPRRPSFSLRPSDVRAGLALNRGA